ncbi:death-inducer obliterator 1 isoform X3 [Cololabis saira]|uniref:death-inducer obliterator 1 isoform X3 n=1 Tax=Cololabis saira TaxID=129043 RepID=UPI002AD54CCB|nr:death-inducer obliterator 1 isoform X3 [Cololabis saira]
MDAMENNNPTNDDDDNSEEQQSLSEGAEAGVRPTLSQVRKSWGFRRTTIAKREFMAEVGELANSPPLVRRGRSRRTNLTLQTDTETDTTQRARRSTRSVLEDLQWSAPSSPVSEPVPEDSAVVSLDPSLWQDFGSAFHTAFSLLGGDDAPSVTDTDPLGVTDILEPTNEIEEASPQVIDLTEVHDKVDDMEITQSMAPENVAEGEIHDIVMISSQEEDSDELTLSQIKEQLISSGRGRATGGRGGKGGRRKVGGNGRGRGKGRRKGKGRGRGRGKAIELQSIIADGEDSDDELLLENSVEQQHLQEEEKENNPHSPTEFEVSSAHFSVTHSPARQESSSNCIFLASDFNQTTAVSHGQYDDALEEVGEEEEKKDAEITEEYPNVSDPEQYDSSVLCCICHQNHDKRLMISCDSCEKWFHGDCVGISDTEDQKMERKRREYTCPPCITKKEIKPQSHSQPESEFRFPEHLAASPAGEELLDGEEQLSLKETREGVEKEEQALKMRPETDMETDSSLPVCMGPGCSKQPLPDSVYCGSNCIVQHAALTMQTLSDPKVPKSKGLAQRKPATARPTVKAERPSRVSKRLAGKTSENAEEGEMKEDVGKQEMAASPTACDPSLTDVQSTSIASSNLDTASNEVSKKQEDDPETMSLSKQSPEDWLKDTTPATEDAPLESQSEEKPGEPEHSGVECAGSGPSTPSTPAKLNHTSAAPSPTNSSTRHHGTGALIVTKTAYVIPKKQSASQSPSGHVAVSASFQKPPPGPTLVNETRNLPVSPAPSAPSARPSQPNNQVRQSIQRSLTSILFKRICECQDLEISESEVAKLVASIEMEMFDIFRNTDSKYMNKYRTIMFNLKDPRNKGLLYRVVRGEIGAFRLVRMTQKDMQATKAPEPIVKETAQVKDGVAKVTSLQKPEAVKVDLLSLNPAKSDKKPDTLEQKRNVSAPPVKPRVNQLIQNSAVPNILSCMLKDTTSEHKAHLFDLKCKICTGQKLASEGEEPAKKKVKTSISREKHEPFWKKSAANSPLRAPPDSPDMDSPASPPTGPSSHLIMDSPKLTIVESPASPTMDSPTSPTLESPASPIMESPASPTPETPEATQPKRTYTPVAVLTVPTVTISRRDPRTAANRFTASPANPNTTVHNQTPPYAPLKETIASRSAPQSSPKPPLKVPKSILMKPSSTADPRLYGASSRNMAPRSSADGDTVQFLAKQDFLWKGFLNMLTVAKFCTRGYLVSGSAENLKADLPDTIQIGGRILPETVWDYVEKLKTSVTKELCVIRFHPATEEEEVAYVSLFSYFSSRGRFGVVSNIGRSIKDVYLVPLSANESIPSILQPLEGPGLEKKRPNLLLGLAIVQKGKRPGSLSQETEEKKPKVNVSKDPMWIPKPPVLYGSDKLEIFQPYDPETPANTTPPGSPSGSSSSGSLMPWSPLMDVLQKQQVPRRSQCFLKCLDQWWIQLSNSMDRNLKSKR